MCRRALLSLEEALEIGRARWQIELLFKLWKSEGRIDESTSQKPYRVLCELYAKLVAMVVQHWVLLVSGWEHVDRSLVKMAQTVRHRLGAGQGGGATPGGPPHHPRTAHDLWHLLPCGSPQETPSHLSSPPQLGLRGLNLMQMRQAKRDAPIATEGPMSTRDSGIFGQRRSSDEEVRRGAVRQTHPTSLRLIRLCACGAMA